MHGSLAEMIPDAVTPQQFRKVMGSFGTGISVLTASYNDSDFGMTVNSLTSVSLVPCMLLVCVKNGSGTGAAIRKSGRFGISVLGLHQSKLSREFCGSDAQRWSACETDRVCGVPLVRGALSGLVCDLDRIVPAGDHEIVIGQAVHCSSRPGAPLMFFRGWFGSFDEFALFPDSGARL